MLVDDLMILKKTKFCKFKFQKVFFSMKEFVEEHPNWDQYRILQAAIAGFLMQKGFQNRDLTRLYIGNMFSMNFKD